MKWDYISAAFVLANLAFYIFVIVKISDLSSKIDTLIEFHNVPSDIRLKRNVEFLEETNGHKMYKFQYLWSDEIYVGVMAQDLMGTKYQCALQKRPDGFFNVDYNQLGLKMTSFHEKCIE
jgi:hypothetical protein